MIQFFMLIANNFPFNKDNFYFVQHEEKDGILMKDEFRN
jgi:hypothetical protein